MAPRASQHGAVGRRQRPVGDGRDHRQGVELLQLVEHGGGRQLAQERRQDGRLLHLPAQPEIRLVDGDHGDQPHQRDAEQGAQREPSDGVERGQRPPQHAAADHHRQRACARLQGKPADQRQRQAGGGNPPRLVAAREQKRGDPRAQDRTHREPGEPERVGHQTPPRALHGRQRDPRQHDQVDHCHHRVIPGGSAAGVPDFERWTTSRSSAGRS